MMRFKFSNFNLKLKFGDFLGVTTPRKLQSRAWEGRIVVGCHQERAVNLKSRLGVWYECRLAREPGDVFESLKYLEKTLRAVICGRGGLDHAHRWSAASRSLRPGTRTKLPGSGLRDYRALFGPGAGIAVLE
jgi:hypothetical protein